MNTAAFPAACAALLLAASGAAAGPDGASVFTQNCSACHQVTGKGVPGAFPALDGDPFVKGDPKAVAYVVTHGRGGMPNFSEELTDDEIAAALTYVRSSWSNHASPVDAATVAAARGAGLAARKDPSALPGH
jgi:mono/diheme cytochrome c family protein